MVIGLNENGDIMKWEEYKKKFYHYATYNQKSEEYISSCLDYAERLFMKDLPVIYDQKHLSQLVGYREEYLFKVANASELFYRNFKVLKKNKKDYREISEPLPNLKDIQRWILDQILYKLEPSEYSKAFRKGVSIKDNAKFHRKQKKVLTIDIENYFGTIKFKAVFKFFKSLGYTKQVSMMLAKLCVIDDELPQGAPTSPMLATLITKNIDKRLSAFANKEKIRYTRYADDLTFSGDFNEGYVIKFAEKVINSEGFKVNPFKTRVRLQHQRQEVTGIVVNEKLQASRQYRRKFRQNMFFIRKFGLESHIININVSDPKSYVYQLIGTANFIRNINPKDIDVQVDYEYLKELLQTYK
ncbi:UNVERIFIED_CONTAM: RNA-directed DNA polymerase [Lysinibacillus xylanilyticus]|nr:reverse transcriptase family protein [Lysinibacillus xylanilyticus]